MKTDLKTIQDLREITGLGMTDCKEALVSSSGDVKKAVEILRKQGKKVATKKESRIANQGLIETYTHANGKIGVIVEINCETDFVARNPEFKEFAHDIALQIAALNPLYVKKEDVPLEVIEKEKEIIKESVKIEGKTPQVIDKIIEGKLENFFKETCLLEQDFIKDPSQKIKDILNDKIAKTGENIIIKRFQRYSLGE